MNDYIRQARKCLTINQLNGLHIRCENVMSPLQVLEFHRDLTSGHLDSALVDERPDRPADRQPDWRSVHARDWITRQRAAVEFSDPSKVQPFRGRHLMLRLSHYTDGAPAAGKTLLIGLTGNAQRLMVPLPVVLQHLDAALCDVAIVRSEPHTGFRNGVPEVADDIEGLAAGLARLLRTDRYARVAIFGTSGGALPAILLAPALGARAVLAGGGNNPDDPRWAGLSEGRGAPGLFGRFGVAGRRDIAIHLAWGERSVADREAADRIAACVAVASQQPVPGAGHVFVGELVRTRRFRPLLLDTLFADATGRATSP